MRYSSSALVAAIAVTDVLGHGVVTKAIGANGVEMPALSIIDGTPRDCPTPLCGSEADTSIIRNNELGTSRASALGRTNGGGPVDASKMMRIFMNGAAANSSAVVQAREDHAAMMAQYSKLAVRAAGGATRTPAGTKETMVKAATGAGVTSGLPTTADDGTISMVFHQVNQDGAGPLVADIDATSGGKDVAAFKKAQVVQNVPGLGVGGLSAAQVMDFPVKVQMPAGMTCQGAMEGATNVCIARLRNNAVTGPFGGSVAFTQSPNAKKRAIEHNLAKRRFARSLQAADETDDSE